ncbi:energy-coupling factor transporter ATPase [Fructobacillus fructosus]|uniref:energy-coupling factor transporter ATPase n=1 Tax=Fructobacillus fructosus TaxID=1631 RepID=UPI002DAC6504|nr:Energy-coupling factor transporter ATP-binding protein EcfA2 (EcfA2) [Fructobacillus fructosus]CAK1244269.1 Energy-coupling factor transporter ATP-binding protein EcfA2 (EcfA2) [Fructobacillus fructosus]CAK1245034.1 Energy-coupling factor transporter ATP-binding protein EcfA2 (EcfA2) [Fructobacillus fructosus]
MVIKIEGLDFAYGAGKQSVPVLKNINVTIQKGMITAIIGQTGSGKSTLLQQLNALLKPTKGTVQIGDHVVTNKTKEKELAPIRAEVGMVFQFPESQLFAPTVLEDVMYGPKNFGATDEEAKKAAKTALQRVGFDATLYEQSPFNLSGGQMRRVALAGVLAMNPQTMVFDEPAAGLDPQGQEELLNLLKSLRDEGKTVVLISHQMDQVLALADRVLVLKDGEIAADEPVDQLFSRPQSWFAEQHLDLPETIAFQKQLEEKGFVFDGLCKTVPDLAKAIKKQLDPTEIKTLGSTISENGEANHE